MFAAFFSILVVMVFLGICSDFIMRVRLSRRESPQERLLWWRRGGDEVAAVYQEVFPRTHLPLFRNFVFWLVLSCAIVLLLFVMWKRS